MIRTNSEQGRIEYIDLAKGFCILFVVIMQYTISIEEGPHKYMNDFLSFVRMPLYFFLSGIFFKDYGSWGATIVKKFNRLVIPAVFFILITYPQHYKLLMSGYHILYPTSFSEFTQWINHNPVVWFLFTLFISNVLFYPLIIYVRKEWIRILIVCLLPVLSLKVDNLVQTYYITAFFTSAPYFYAGHYMRTHTDWLSRKVDRKKLLLISLTSFAIAVVAWYILDMVKYSVRLPLESPVEFSYYLLSASCIVALIALCKAIIHLPVISRIGRYSIIFLGLHTPIVEATMHFTKNLDINPYYIALIHFAVAMTIVLTLAIPILTRYFPWFCAQSDLIPYPLWHRKK